MLGTNVQRSSHISQGELPSGPSRRITHIRAYQQLARTRLKERLSGSPTAATFYDLLMQDQLASIKLTAHA